MQLHKVQPVSKVMRFVVFRMPALLYMGLIFYSSSRPVSSPTLQAIPDYILHCGGYALLYVLAFWAVHEGWMTKRGKGGYWLPAGITVLYGFSDEFHQSFVLSRNASGWDLLADAAGVLLGAWMMVPISRWLSSVARER